MHCGVLTATTIMWMHDSVTLNIHYLSGCVSYFHVSIFNSTIQSVPCHSNNTHHAMLCRHLSHNGWFTHSSFAVSQILKRISMATTQYKRSQASEWLNWILTTQLIKWNMTELLWQCDSKNIHLKAKTFLHTATMTVAQTISLIQTTKSGLTINTGCQYSVPVVHRFTWGPHVLQQKLEPVFLKTPIHIAFHALYFSKFHSCRWKI
jgi:hypothetical protein